MCGMNVLTAVQLSKDVDAQLIVDAASRPAKGFARWRERTSWPWKLLLAWCITVSRPCTRSVNWEATLCPRAFSIFENLSFGALSDEMKLDVWFVQVRRLALFEGWFTKFWPVDGFCSFGQRAKSRSREVSWNLSGSATCFSSNWKTQRCEAPRSQWCSAESISSSIRMACRKTWPEGVAERRG